MKSFNYFLFVCLTFFSSSGFAEPTFGNLLEHALIEMQWNTKFELWSKRARYSAWLPKVSLLGRFRDRMGDGTTEKSNFFRDESGSLLHEWTQAQSSLKNDHYVEIQIRFQWSLEELIFHPTELQAAALAGRRRQAKLEFIEALSVSFAQWKVLHKKKDRSEAEEIEIIHLETFFNAITGNAFSKWRQE